MNWDPEQYLKFVEERRRPALDLIAQLAEGGVLAVQMPSDFVAPSHLARLDAVVREQFLAAYRAPLAVVYPRGSDGHTLFPFKRLFIVALR